MITLRKVDSRNIWSVIRLKVHDEQQSFVATNTESILQDIRPSQKVVSLCRLASTMRKI